MRAGSAALAALLVAGAAGCRGAADLAPRLDAVEPAHGDPAAASPVRIRGRFRVRASQSLSGSGGDAVEAGYRAWLDGTELGSVTWLDEGTLTAVVPAGMAAGLHGLAVTDPEGRRATLAGAWFAGLPSVTLASAVTLDRTTAAVGQAVTLSVVVTNGGNYPARGLLPQVALSGTGSLRAVAAPVPVDLAAGASATFDFAWTAASPGGVTLDVTAEVPSPSGGTAAAPPWSGTVQVQEPPVLTATLVIPTDLLPGTFTATMTVQNGGGATAAGVRPGALAVAAGSAAAASEVVPFDGPADIPGGEARSFTTTWTASGAGALALRGSAAGLDANTGAPVATGLVTSNVATVGATVVVDLVAVDPAGDGSPHAFVNGWRGGLLAGPNRTARTAAWRSGGAWSQLSFALPQDSDNPGDMSRNAWAGAPPYPSLGSPACTAPDLEACGPDNEDARGGFSVLTVGGAEWLVAGPGRRAADLHYVYLSPAAGSPLPFRFWDLAKLLDSTGLGLTASAVLQDVIYLGFSGAHPQLVALSTVPAVPGTDANAGRDGPELAFDAMPGVGGSGTPANAAPLKLVDALAAFSNRLYAANNGGMVRATVAKPVSYAQVPADWVACTPSAAAWAAKTSLTSASGVALDPRDRAVPAFAAWKGRLFAVRNTTDGPQLWSCNPETSGGEQVCGPADWSLAAANLVGDTQLTQLNGDSTRASLLVATGSWLYLGLEGGSGGIRLFRTSASIPLLPLFTGDGGCIAGLFGCQGLGGDGLGDASLRILDGKALAPGGAAGLYFTAGNGTGPVRVYRILD